MIALAIIGVACSDVTPGTFRIEGELATLPGETVYLVRTVNGQDDTLGQGVLRDGKFQITGNIEGVKNATLVINNHEIPVLLEQGLFQIRVNPFKIDNNTPFQVRGKEQELFERYWKMYAEFEMKRETLTRELQRSLFMNDTTLYSKAEASFENIGRECQAAVNEMIRQNPDSYMAAYLIHYWRNTMELEELEARYELLGAKAREYDLAQIVREKIDNLKGVQIGCVAPDFMLETPEGKPFGLKDLTGKVKIIDFWASWCGPCRKENPNMVRLYSDYKQAGLNILSISIDDNKKSWLSAIKADGMPWHHASDLKGWDGPVTRKYAVGAVPRIIVLDEDNRVVAFDIRGDELRAKVKELLGK